MITHSLIWKMVRTIDIIEFKNKEHLHIYKKLMMILYLVIIIEKMISKLKLIPFMSEYLLTIMKRSISKLIDKLIERYLIEVQKYEKYPLEEITKYELDDDVGILPSKDLADSDSESEKNQKERINQIRLNQDKTKYTKTYIYLYNQEIQDHIETIKSIKYKQWDQPIIEQIEKLTKVELPKYEKNITNKQEIDKINQQIIQILENRLTKIDIRDIYEYYENQNLKLIQYYINYQTIKPEEYIFIEIYKTIKAHYCYLHSGEKSEYESIYKTNKIVLNDILNYIKNSPSIEYWDKYYKEILDKENLIIIYWNGQKYSEVDIDKKNQIIVDLKNKIKND